jgi:hypothetical protein
MIAVMGGPGPRAVRAGAGRGRSGWGGGGGTRFDSEPVGEDRDRVVN